MRMVQKLTELEASEDKEANKVKNRIALKLSQLLQKGVLRHYFSYTDFFDTKIYRNIINMAK